MASPALDGSVGFMVNEKTRGDGDDVSCRSVAQVVTINQDVAI